MKQGQLIQEISEIIAEIPSTKPLRVAVDGVDASSKTTFAAKLANALELIGRQVILVSVDGFHHPKAIRRRKDPLSPEGFYRDSYNYPALIKNLLAPLSPQGDRRYRTAVFNLRQDQPVDLPWQTAHEDAILIMEGIFLLRPILLPYWDFTIYLHVDFTNTIARGIARDAPLFQSEQETRRRYEQRYIPGQKIYLAEACPLDKADILIDNNILDDPKIIENKLKLKNNRKGIE